MGRYNKGTIGLFINQLEEYYNSNIWPGVVDVVEERGMNLIIFSGKALKAPEGSAAQHTIIYNLASRENVDGLVISTGSISNYVTDDELAVFLKLIPPVPAVSIGRNVVDIPSFLVDNKSGIYKTLNHLTTVHKCRQIAFITGDIRNPDAAERLEAYKEAVTASGLPYDSRLVVQGNFSGIYCSDILDTLLDRRNILPDAIIASNDVMAIRIIPYLKERGYKVPGDIIVTGFDDSPEARFGSPPLTTVKQPLYRMTRQATELLIEMMETGRQTGETRVIPTEVVIRESCGCTKEVNTADTDPLFAHFKDSQSYLPGVEGIQEVILRKLKDINGSENDNTRLAEKIYNHLNSYYTLNYINMMWDLRFTNEILVSTFEFTKLIEGITGILPVYNIKSFYISLYSTPARHPDAFTWSIPGRSNLVLAYVDGRVVKINEQGINYSTKKLIPGRFLPANRRHTMIIAPLVFEEEQFGFVITEMGGKRMEVITELLRGQISSALMGTNIIRDLRLAERKLKKTNRELKWKTLQLEEVLEQKTRFFINVAHETRTPLTLIKNYMDKYLRNPGDINDLYIVRKNIDTLLMNMINFLDVEKLRQGEMNYLHGQWTGLSQLLKNKIPLFRETAMGKKINITGEVEEECFTRADPYAIERVFNNLLDNAVKYTPHNGSINILLQKKFGKILFVIEDTGVGIPPGDLDNVFLPYYRLSHKKEGIHGMGMGLYITKRILDSIGAQVTIRSLQDHGTTFEIEFAAGTPGEGETVNLITDGFHPPPPVLHEQGIPGEDFDESKPGILVVEDNPEMLFLLKNTLKTEYNIFQAANGLKALINLKTLPLPDLIISDIMMDEMDGYSLLAKLMENESYSNVPFLFLSARTSEQDKLKGLASGAIDYMPKPFSIEELKAKVSSIIELKKRISQKNSIHFKKKLKEYIRKQNPGEKPEARFKRICSYYKITSRQREVLNLLLNGYAYKEIGYELKISMKTVEYHIRNIYRKLNINNRLKLDALFF